MKVVIAGGGWAGLSAAVELTRQGIPCTVCEAAAQPGGRARNVHHDGWQVDNGQHIMLGAYEEILNLLKVLNVPESTVLKRQPLQLNMHSLKSGRYVLKTPQLPAPLHLLYGLLRMSGLRLEERWQALRACLALARRRFHIIDDLNLADWLHQQRQSKQLIKVLWEPLCLATLNTPPHEASTKVFARVIGDAFARRRVHSDLLMFKTAIGDSLPRHAQRYLENHGSRVILKKRITALATADHTVTAVKLGNNTTPVDHIILATPPWISQTLLQPHRQTAALATQLNALRHYPICTIYLQYAPHVTLETDMIGMVDSLGQWVFDRTLTGQPGLMAVVISGPGPHMTMTNPALAQQITAELATLNPHWPAPLDWKIIREKRATFACHTNIHTLRAPIIGPLRNLWLAGDYMDTGYPATLEGAVRSGLTCAREVAKAIENKTGVSSASSRRK